MWHTRTVCYKPTSHPPPGVPTIPPKKIVGRGDSGQQSVWPANSLWEQVIVLYVGSLHLPPPRFPTIPPKKIVGLGVWIINVLESPPAIPRLGFQRSRPKRSLGGEIVVGKLYRKQQDTQQTRCWSKYFNNMLDPASHPPPGANDPAQKDRWIGDSGWLKCFVVQTCYGSLTCWLSSILLKKVSKILIPPLVKKIICTNLNN